MIGDEVNSVASTAVGNEFDVDSSFSQNETVVAVDDSVLSISNQRNENGNDSVVETTHLVENESGTSFPVRGMFGFILIWFNFLIF